jgi:TetR/AcrR family transcriptional regulator, regulator of autoinduction and epiphytic fitness
MPASAAGLDGRLARSVRSRDAVVDAMLALLQEGDLQPTAARVADRAGVSLRLVFQHFDELEALYAAAADRQGQRIRALFEVPHTSGPFSERLRTFVVCRARALETIAPVRRAALLRAPFSRVIARGLHDARTLARRQLEATFQPELGAHPPRIRRELATALAVASGFSAWEALRRHHRLSVADAQRVMARTVRALLS